MTTSDVGDSQQSHDLRRAAEQGTIRRAEHHGSSHAHTRTPGTEDLLSRQYTRDDVDKWARAAGPEISPTAFLLFLTSVEVTHPDSGDVNSTVQALANDSHMSRKLAAAKLNELAAAGYSYYSTECMQTALVLQRRLPRNRVEVYSYSYGPFFVGGLRQSINSLKIRCTSFLPR